MGNAKDIIVKVIPSNIANPFIKKHHYSGKVVNNSTLHFGVWYRGGVARSNEFWQSNCKKTCNRIGC